MSSELIVELRGDHIVVTRPGTDFSATFRKPGTERIVRLLTATLEPGADRGTIFQFRAQAFAAATNKARELGWIV
jgi:hypothetical protein